MELKTIVLSAAAWLALSGAAVAGKAAEAGPEPMPLGAMTTGYTYYNRPGADIAAHDAAVKACAAEAMKVHYVGEGQPLTYTATARAPGETAAQAAGVGIAANLIVDAMIIEANHIGHIGAVAAGLENCMLVRGWRVVLLPDREGSALAGLAPAALSQQLAPWVGAEAPHGRIMRVFNNDAASGVRPRLGIWPKSGASTAQLSYAAATGGSFKSFAPRGTQPIAPGVILDARRPTPWTAAQLPTKDEMRPIVIITLTGLSAKTGTGIALERMDPAGHGVDERVVLDQSSGIFSKKTGDTVAILITAGRWRIASIGDLSFCLGSPAFDAKAGEVIYAGAFDLKADKLGPNLDLAAPKTWLGAAPSVAHLQPAAYENGSTSVCGGNVLYALEIPGAPFAPGYGWGSQAWAPAAGAAAAPVAATSAP